MTVWLIEPRDPLIVREGRPFGPDPGASAASLPFPFPSTTAGGARTRSALNEDGIFHYDDLDRLREMRIRGPLLAQLADGDNKTDAGVDTWLLPIPGDVQLFATETKEEVLLRRFMPLDRLAGAQTDFDQHERERHLYLVGLDPSTPVQVKRKPLSFELRYWYWQHFQHWLLNPAELIQKGALSLSLLGQKDLVREHRLHVSMDSDKEVGKEGLLFATSGLEFTRPGGGEKRLHNAQRLALAIDIEDKTLTPQAGIAGFAGERRLVTWRKSDAQFPICHNDIQRQIVSDGGYCRLVLLTPAFFEQGYFPTWLCKAHAQTYGVTVEVKAIVVRRPQVVSGWDFAIRKPKPSRRLAPAGTVLFLSVQGDDNEVANWVENTWMQCISDDEQSRRDGFGLAALGTWSERPLALQKGKQ